ncbi:hypothetical protein LSH36_642g03013 [Paralvinella palmiformis]|uniref:Uncharacterized protein n=1 Tax=Paralvinella palmiformis TaxID=53620 RepID=A0AAD9J4H1_9ANNE|nr:hypothetical protein LSH36_642g03013 [Paralvinella palmiformis]
MEAKLRLPNLVKASERALSQSNQQLMANTPRSATIEGQSHPYLTPPERSQSVDSFAEYSTQFAPHAQAIGHDEGKSSNRAIRREKSWYSKRIRRRLVYKNGECNISHVNIKKRRQRYLADIFTTLVDIKWRWNLLIFILAFTLSWLLFALCWWLICFANGDFENYGRADHQPCVAEVHDFTTALLFSIETQHTIGYGFRHTTPKCPEAILVMMFQSCFGVIIQALMTGLVFAKLSRPKKRAETLMFSKNAVVCRRDGRLCLLFRVGDMRKSHIVEAHVRAIMIKKRVTSEGEVMPLYQYEVSVGDEEGESRLFLVWPVILEHPIDESSPFWDVSPDDLQREQFELIIILEGIVESTGMTTQARTSYLPGEILWGHRFERLVTYQKDNGEYEIDYSRFHSTIPVDIPQCSAKDLAELSQSGSFADPDDPSRGEDPDGCDDDDDPDHSMSSRCGSTAASPERPHTPLIIKRNGIAQTGFELDSSSPEFDFPDIASPVNTYQFVGGNHV